jgi:hypothetical protein
MTFSLQWIPAKAICPSKRRLGTSSSLLMPPKDTWVETHQQTSDPHIPHQHSIMICALIIACVLYVPPAGQYFPITPFLLSSSSTSPNPSFLLSEEIDQTRPHGSCTIIILVNAVWGFFSVTSYYTDGNLGSEDRGSQGRFFASFPTHETYCNCFFFLVSQRTCFIQQSRTWWACYFIFHWYSGQEVRFIIFAFHLEHSLCFLLFFFSSVFVFFFFFFFFFWQVNG